VAKSSSSKATVASKSKSKGKPVARPARKVAGKSAVTSKATPAKTIATKKPAAKTGAGATIRAATKSTAARPAVGAKTPVAAGKVAVVAAKPVVATAAAGSTPKTARKKPVTRTPPGPKLVPGAIYLKPAFPSKPSTTPVAAAAPVSNGKKVEKVRLKNRKKHPPEPAYRPPLQEPVPTDGKPRKNQAGLTARELEHFRDLLLEKRREIVGDLSSMEREALRSGVAGLSSLPVHMADMGTDNYEQEFTLGLVEKDRTLLREINAALGKIQNGTYGLCEGTGLPINKVRLEAQPWTRYSIEHARVLERQRGLR
jgi:DnaK suppressor protein